MINKKTEIVLIHPGDKRVVYQDLATTYSAIQPPVWCGILASVLKAAGFNVQIIDANALNLSPIDIAATIKEITPLLVGIFVSGVHPSASTQTMPSAIKICKAIKNACDIPIVMAGLHPSALPRHTLETTGVDFVIQGDGLSSFPQLLHCLKSGSDIKNTPGLWFYDASDTIAFSFKPGPVTFFPRVAWDLLPMSRYQAHYWQCLSDISNRKPYACLYTSIGCPFHCKFCCVHALWQTHQVIYQSLDTIMTEIDCLVNKYHIRCLHIADENFLLNPNHYMPVVSQLISRQYDLNIWAYGRVDSIQKEHLELLRKAGIQWLALGIESSDTNVLRAVAKPFHQEHVVKTVQTIQEAGIHVMGNFMFGLPDDRMDTLEQTLAFAKQLKCDFVNFNCMMPFPGTIYYDQAVQDGTAPASWQAYSQHAYETQPMPTKYLPSEDILKFRDQAFIDYFSDTDYLMMIENKMGSHARQHIETMTQTRLCRKLISKVINND